MMSRIGMVVHNYYLRDARVRRYAEALVSEGHEVEVFCLREGNDTGTSEHFRGVDIYGIQMTRKRGGFVRYLLEYARSFLFLMFMLTRRHLCNPYDVIHIHNMPNFLVIAGILPKLFGKKLILDLHDSVPETYKVKFNISSHFLFKLFG